VKAVFLADAKADMTELGRYLIKLLVGMNRIIYEVRDETLYIHIICDARRDLRTLLLRRVLRP